MKFKAWYTNNDYPLRFSADNWKGAVLIAYNFESLAQTLIRIEREME